jgi:methanogenic corrinoid protein MtbC1
MPAESIASAVIDNRADVLGISTTMHFHLNEVRSLIDTVRASEVSSHLKIIVGGYSFNVAPGLYKKIGADAYAEDAGQAVAVANRLLTDSSRQESE